MTRHESDALALRALALLETVPDDAWCAVAAVRSLPEYDGMTAGQRISVLRTLGLMIDGGVK